MRSFADRLQLYTELIRRALDLMEHGLESELEVLRRRCRTAWGDAEEARIALYHHEADHSCGVLSQERRQLG